jgi:hypothetical protein
MCGLAGVLGLATGIGGWVMRGQGDTTARFLGVLLAGILASGLPVVAAAEDKPVAAALPGAADQGPKTLQDAVEAVAQHFNITVIGANRLGTDRPSWPAGDLGPEAMLGALLKGYSYAVVLKPQTSPEAVREPDTLLIAGLYHPAAETAKPAFGAPAPAPAPASAETAAAAPMSYAPSWAVGSSTVVRALTKLAGTNSSNMAAGENTGSAPPLPNPAQNAAAMASLTQSAQAGLGALVIGLRQACPTPNSC